MAPSPSRTFPPQNIAARRRNGHARAPVLPRIACRANARSGSACGASRVECTILYRYCAKIRAVHLPIAEWQRSTVDTVMTVTDFLASGLLIPNSVDFKRQFRAACGYAELGMATESIAELNAIDDEFQHRPEVLQLRLHHLM